MESGEAFQDASDEFQDDGYGCDEDDEADGGDGYAFFDEVDGYDDEGDG